MGSHEPVLLLENEALIAIYMEDLLREAGYEAISTHSSCVDARDWLAENTPILAIIETRLRDGPCDEIAATLAQREIPYIVHSVERDAVGRHPMMRSKCKWLDKPCDPREFLEAVKDCTVASV